MTTSAIVQMTLLLLLLIAFNKPLGTFMARLFNGERTFLHPVLRPVERLIYKLCMVDEDEDMPWTRYTLAMLAFSAVGALLTYVLLRAQGVLPFNPQHFAGKDMTPDLALNTAVSFTTNTNWQAYVPEAAVSYFSNMVALAIHNWMSAATGIALAVALVRGLARKSANGTGNFWVDAVRATLYLLLPITACYALFLIQQGVPQNFASYTKATTLEGPAQTIGQGPVASQEAIKMLGTNGGGFFNANSAHPYENPTPLTNFVQILSIFLIPSALTYMFGRMVGNTRQGWAIFAAMAVLFVAGDITCTTAEQNGNRMVARLGVQNSRTAGQPGGNMEGKDQRFGIAASSLFATVTTDASCGAVNAMHDSFTPIGGMVPLLNILSGEVIFGGVGAGLYGMLMFAVLAVFIAGLMVGRTPEYLGKKIEQFEVKMAMLAVLVLAMSILGFTALSTNLNLPATSKLNLINGSSPPQFEGATYNNVNNNGPHGLTEILYSYTSATGNNGSAFAGISANTPYYNITLTLAMFLGRFMMIIPLMAIAGSLARKTPTPVSLGTFPTDTATFVLLLVGTVVIVGALTFFPALALGPIVEHLQMLAGKLV